MTATQMTIICNIQMMREKITGKKTDYNNVKNSDLYSMTEEKLYKMQNSLITEYNKALNFNKPLTE